MGGGEGRRGLPIPIACAAGRRFGDAKTRFFSSAGRGTGASRFPFLPEPAYFMNFVARRSAMLMAARRALILGRGCMSPYCFGPKSAPNAADTGIPQAAAEGS